MASPSSAAPVALVECNICLESIYAKAERQEEKAEALSCCHVFHRGCIVRWLEENSTCPTCRMAIVNGAHPTAPSSDLARLTARVFVIDPRSDLDRVRTAARTHLLAMRVFNSQGV